MKNVFFTITTLFVLFSCEQKEKARPKHQPGDITTKTIDMSTDYKYQVFFDFERGEEVSRNLKTDWNLKFYKGKVYTNTATGASVAKVEDGNIAEIASDHNLSFKYDVASKHADSLVIDDISSNNTFVYVCKLGFDTKLNALDTYKITIVQNTSTNKIKLQYAKLSDDKVKELEINDTEPVYFSFKNQVINIISTNWDICFTQYINVFHDPYNPYLVTGVLSNHNIVKTVELKQGGDFTFESFSLENSTEVILNNKADEIGYDWKTYSFENHGFTMDKTKFYVIKSSSGKVFKCRFIDFYDENGNKGNPKFEFQEL